MNIPKIILQINNYNPPKYVIDLINIYTPDWNYFFFNENMAVDYLKQNKIKEYEFCVEIYNNLNNIYAKNEFFRYFFLLINGGVFLDSNAMIERNIDDLIDKYCFISSKCFDGNGLFNGFLAVSKNNIIIRKCFKYMYDLGFETLNVIYKQSITSMNMYLYNALMDITNDIRYIIQYETKCKILDETLNNNRIEIKDNSSNTLFVSYYIDNKPIPSPVSISLPVMKSVQETNIGITLYLPDELKNVFSNGGISNIIFLGELLCKTGYNVYFIMNNELLNKWNNNKDYCNVFYDSSFNIINEYNIFLFDFDIIIVGGYLLEKNILNTLKEMKTKIVLYSFGTEHLNICDYLLHEKNINIPFFINDSFTYDKIWCLPHEMYLNKYLLETYSRCEVVEIPFVWSPRILQNMESLYKNKSFLYKKKKDEKSIAIFEPNLSVHKFFLPPVLICENAYRILEDKSKLKHLYITNITDKNIDAVKVTNSVKYLDITKDNKVTIEGRFNTLEFISEFADIAVSHQWELNFNYLYLDLAWWGWPIVHNANFCKDIGYYYEGFNYKLGGKILEDVILHHDSNINEYIEKNRSAIHRFLPTCIDLQNSHKKLIENLYNNP